MADSIKKKLNLNTTFETREEAAEFVREYCAFYDQLWSPTTKWTMEHFQKMNADNNQLVWQGQATEGIEQMIEKWKPIKGAFVEVRTLGFDVETHTETMVAFTQYLLFKTFKDQETFVVQRVVVDRDDQGKVLRHVYVLEKQYGDLVMETMEAFVSV